EECLKRKLLSQLAAEPAFVRAVIATSSAEGANGNAAMIILAGMLHASELRVAGEHPDLLPALAASPHFEAGFRTMLVHACRRGGGEEEAIALVAGSGALVDMLSANMSACKLLLFYGVLLTVHPGNARLVVGRPGFVAAVAAAALETTGAELGAESVSLGTDVELATLAMLNVFSAVRDGPDPSLIAGMAADPQVTGALVHLLRACGRVGAAAAAVIEEKVICALFTLGGDSAGQRSLREDPRVLAELLARSDLLWSRRAVWLICHGASWSAPDAEAGLAAFCGRRFHAQGRIVRALVREAPGDVAAALAAAEKAGLTEILPLLRDCASARARGHSLAHLVGYSREQARAARAQRDCWVLCLRRAAGGGGRGRRGWGLAAGARSLLRLARGRAGGSGGGGRELDARLAARYFDAGAGDPLRDDVLRFAF
ncbi:hypothetical protein TeGR_g14519, partial [Tetraparma gracilis]